jgi:hypothetical protein
MWLSSPHLISEGLCKWAKENVTGIKFFYIVKNEIKTCDKTDR